MLAVHAEAREQKKVVGVTPELQEARKEIEGKFGFADRFVTNPSLAIEGRTPIAQVGEVSDESPASRAGLQVGDLVLKFGTVEHNPAVANPIPVIGKVVADSEGKSIPIYVRRHVGGGVHQVKKLFMTPQKWKGRGLLGYIPPSQT